MRTLGIDLASQPADTAAVGVDWSRPGEPGVVALSESEPGPLDDEALLRLIDDRQWARIGIDVPLGWPLGMVELLDRWHAGEPIAAPVDLRADGSPLLHRGTDRAVHRRIGKWPMAVGAEKLARVALRAFDLLSLSSREIDRSGLAGGVIETYPKALVACWLGTSGDGTKGSAEHRAAVLDMIERALALRLESADRERIIGSGKRDHHFDALLCALAARAAAIGLTEPPGARELVAARLEGWIHLPSPGVGLGWLATAA